MSAIPHCENKSLIKSEVSILVYSFGNAMIAVMRATTSTSVIGYFQVLILYDVYTSEYLF